MQMTADEEEAVDSLVGLGKERSQNNESYTVDAYIAAKYGQGIELNFLFNFCPCGIM